MPIVIPPNAPCLCISPPLMPWSWYWQCHWVADLREGNETESQASSVRIVNMLQAGQPLNQNSDFWGKQHILLCCTASWPGTWRCFPSSNVDTTWSSCLRLPGTEIKNAWNFFTFTSPYVILTWSLIRNRHNFKVWKILVSHIWCDCFTGDEGLVRLGGAIPGHEDKWP
jgi:hypothetical protein